MHISAGPCYVFPEAITSSPSGVVAITKENADILRADFEDWLADVKDDVPFTAVVREGRVLSVCYSARVTSAAHEAGVETLREFRGRGLASDACVGWAYLVQKLGCRPLYSTSYDNIASQNVARKMGLRRYGATFHVT
jgi:RimJ/RimL family protein N-acetyltransferase